MDGSEVELELFWLVELGGGCVEPGGGFVDTLEFSVVASPVEFPGLLDVTGGEIVLVAFVVLPGLVAFTGDVELLGLVEFTGGVKVVLYPIGLVEFTGEVELLGLVEFTGGDEVLVALLETVVLTELVQFPELVEFTGGVDVTLSEILATDGSKLALAIPTSFVSTL